MIGEYLSATGRTPLQVSAANPWAPLLPTDWDTSSTALESLVMMQNEWGELAFNLTNATADAMELSVAVAALTAGTTPASGTHGPVRGSPVRRRGDDLDRRAGTQRTRTGADSFEGL